MGDATAMRTTLLIITFGLMTALCGCDLNEVTKLMDFKLPKKAAVVELSVNNEKVVNDVELAKIILKPKHRPLSVTQDPFAPLLVSSQDNSLSVENDQLDQDITKDIRFLGLVNMGDKPYALLSVENVNAVYKINDQIKRMVLAEIHQEYIVLKRDSKMIKLNRGDK
jgi:hypothetical protein